MVLVALSPQVSLLPVWAASCIRCREDMAVPFVSEVPDIRDGYVHAFVFRALDKGGEAIVVSADIDELPMVFTAHRLQIVDVLGLEGLIVLASVRTGREFISEILFEFCDFSHCSFPPSMFCIVCSFQAAA